MLTRGQQCPTLEQLAQPYVRALRSRPNTRITPLSCLLASPYLPHPTASHPPQLPTGAPTRVRVRWLRTAGNRSQNTTRVVRVVRT